MTNSARHELTGVRKLRRHRTEAANAVLRQVRGTHGGKPFTQVWSELQAQLRAEGLRLEAAVLRQHAEVISAL